MALFNKLFFTSTNKRKSFNSGHSQNYLSKFPFDPKQVRILLYRECDNRGRRLLFDSNAIQKINLNDCTDNIHSEKLNNNNCRNRTTDSKQFKNLPSGFIELSDGVGYKHNRPNSTDIAGIGEMVFGALAMSFRGTALKVHWMQTPSRLLCSQVFLSPIQVNGSIYYPSTDCLSPRHSITSEQGSIDSFSINSFSMPFSICVSRNLNLIADRPYATNPLDVPEMTLESSYTNTVTSSTGGDSGYSGTTTHDPWATVTSSSSYQYSNRSSLGSLLSDPESIRKFSIDSSVPSATQSTKSSDSSLQRRISRNILTSFENRNSFSDFIGFIGDNYQTTTNGGSDSCVARFRRRSDTNESRSNPEIIRKRGASGDTLLQVRNSSKRAKLGLAVCITMSESFEEEMEQFCCEHIALFESMLCRLRASAENAYMNHKDFLQIMIHAWQKTTQWIVDLLTIPRLECPVWLSITTSGNKYSRNLADHFMRELCWLLSSADTKDTNFFISTMLTAVLTHHLGWVTTVAAFNSKSKNHAAAIAVEQRAKLLEVSQKHPYNALWAQMGDLYGAIGSPAKVSRTIIYGTEKLAIEKFLSVLTYFIRCGEVRRVMKKENFDKVLLDDLINQNSKDGSKKTNIDSDMIPKTKFGIKRTTTSYSNDLSSMGTSDKNDLFDIYETDSVSSHKMNDIPNVLAYRDSRFVQQELRIGNYLMDTGIEKNSKQTKANNLKKEKIRFTVTPPENVEMCLDASDASQTDLNTDLGAVEAIEFDNNSKITESKAKYFWNIEPKVKEGFSWKDLENLQIDANKCNKRITDDTKSNSCIDMHNYSGESKTLKKSHVKHISLSDLITENSVGKSERLTWGIEPIKEVVSLEEEKHFEICQKIVEKEHGIKKDNSNSVVFVLGDNEALVNIKRSTENLTDQQLIATTSKQQHICNQHKKHSGVKFNFEEYPQIATNYMKNKNLTFLDKSSKIDSQFQYTSSDSSNRFPVCPNENVIIENTTNDCCDMCKNSFKTQPYQTPSNATELEFDDTGYHLTNDSKLMESKSNEKFFESIYEKNNSGLKKTKSCFIKDDVHLLNLPVPGVKDVKEDEIEMKVKAGFIPSLFVGVSDHYISDMVLQGTSQPPSTWETSLRDDLTLASHCSTLIPIPTENIAVVADMEKWEVKIVSSQTNTLPYTSATSGPVGISQLVSTMLETVLAMSTSGISAYECLSYLESKLQEMYLQSEALAAFLLATEFCSLNTVTSALNLSDNDVPLLLSVASIHSPQVTKKYGISFR